MHALKKLLPLPAALRLSQAGVKLPTLYGYVYSLDDPSLDTASAALIRSFDAEGWPDEKLNMGYCPAPDFAELWPALPLNLQQGIYQTYILALSGILPMSGYCARYHCWITQQVLVASNAETPVAAAGNLLLQLLNKGLVDSDQVNHHALLNA